MSSTPGSWTSSRTRWPARRTTSPRSREKQFRPSSMTSSVRSWKTSTATKTRKLTLSRTGSRMSSSSPRHRVAYPLEGEQYDEVRFNLYDKVGRKVWGELRIRREKNIDVIHIEARKGVVEGVPFKPIMQLTAHN